jgi:CRP-like cAMP-binding protein
MPTGHERLTAYFRRWGPVPDDQAELLRAAFRPVGVGRGELLVRAGERRNDVHFLVRGLVRGYVVAGSGTERTLWFRREDQLVCSYGAALRTAPAQEYIEALEPSLLLVAARPALDRLCAGHPCWAPILASQTERLYLGYERRSRGLLLDDAATRYRTFLTEQPELAARLTQRHIAAYVGVTPEALSRIRTGQ